MCQLDRSPRVGRQLHPWSSGRVWKFELHCRYPRRPHLQGVHGFGRRSPPARRRPFGSTSRSRLRVDARVRLGHRSGPDYFVRRREGEPRRTLCHHGASSRRPSCEKFVGGPRIKWDSPRHPEAGFATRHQLQTLEVCVLRARSSGYRRT